MFFRLAKILALCAALQMMGGHWVALQSVAWARMLIGNLREHNSVSVAVGKVFDGAHPCSICRTVSKGQQSEQKQQTAEIPVFKVEALLPLAFQLPPRPAVAFEFPAVAFRGSIRAGTPLTPPPRLA